MADPATSTLTFERMPARVNIPAWTNAVFADAQGNIVAKYDAVRPYSKTCRLDLDPQGCPYTATLITITPDVSQQDTDFSGEDNHA